MPTAVLLKAQIRSLFYFTEYTLLPAVPASNLLKAQMRSLFYFSEYKLLFASEVL